MQEVQQESFEGWVVLELMGHRRLAGHLRTEQIGGASFLRMDVIDPQGEALATQFYSPSAVYCITPTTENLARKFMARGFDGPIQQWELRELAAPARPLLEDDFDDEADD